MSGRIVGEVLAASDSLRARGLPPRAFYALLAIAEKASADRTASVRWDHLRAGLYGASKRTAQRAVDDLVAAGVIRVVRPGFRNQHDSRAPVYVVNPLEDCDTCVTRSGYTDDDTQVTRSDELDDDKSTPDDDKPEGGLRHPGVLLDVSFDGSSDGTARRHRPDECNLCDDDGYRNGLPCDGIDRRESNARGSALVRAALQTAQAGGGVRP